MKVVLMIGKLVLGTFEFVDSVEKTADINGIIYFNNFSIVKDNSIFFATKGKEIKLVNNIELKLAA